MQPTSGSTSRAPDLGDLARLRRVRDRMDREYAQPLDVEALARGIHERLGAPSLAVARAAAEEEVAFAASLCGHPVNTVLALRRHL